MGDSEKKLEYSFEFKCADFELEFKGDQNFVLNQLRKYEPKILQKLSQLVPEERAPSPQQIQHPAQAPAPQSHYREERRKYQERRRRHKRSQERYEKEEKELVREPDFVESPRIEEASFSQVREERKLEIEPEDLRSLLERYQPRTAHDRVMLFAYYLEDKIPEFSSAEIQECFQAISEKSPSNLSVVLSNAARSGFLAKEEKAGRARFRLTFKGKRYVENGLRLD